MKNRICSTIAFASALLFSLSIGGCSSTQEEKTPNSKPAASISEEDKTLTIGLTYIPDVQFAPVYVAEKNGYFTDRGLNVTIRHHAPQEPLLDALNKGEEDIVFAGGDEMMQGRSTGISVVNWATMYQQYPAALIVKADSNIDSWEDMAGKTIGLPGPYGENYYAVLAALKEHGLDNAEENPGENAVTLSYIGYTQADALKNGQVDGVIDFTNSGLVALKNKGVQATVIPLADEVPLIGAGFGSLENNIRPEVYADFLDAVEEGAQFAADNPDATIDIVTEYVPSLVEEAQRNTAKQVLAETLTLYRGGDIFGEQHTDQWEAMSVFMADMNLVDKRVPADEAYTTDVLTADRASQM